MPSLRVGPQGQVIYNGDEEQRPKRRDLWLLSADGSKKCVHRYTAINEQSVLIQGSEWTHDFAPAWGLGNFAVFNIPIPPACLPGGVIADTITAAINAARNAEVHLRAGEWGEVCEDLRGVWEILRNQEPLNAMLRTDGYNDDAIANLNSALQGLFLLSSKFVHRRDQKGRLFPEIKASKEDAYLAYSTAMSALNLVARKHNRQSKMA